MSKSSACAFSRSFQTNSDCGSEEEARATSLPLKRRRPSNSKKAAAPSSSPDFPKAHHVFYIEFSYSVYLRSKGFVCALSLFSDEFDYDSEEEARAASASLKRRRSSSSKGKATKKAAASSSSSSSGGSRRKSGASAASAFGRLPCERICFVGVMHDTL